MAAAVPRPHLPRSTGTATSTTTSRPDTSHAVTRAWLACASAAAVAQAAVTPSARRAAPARAARSAAACARCLAETAPPNTMSPRVIDTINATMATATTVAEPSSRRLPGSHRLRRDPSCEPQGWARTDTGDDEPAIVPDVDRRSGRRDAPCRVDRHGGVTPRREPCRFAGRVDAAHVRRDRRHPCETDDQHHDERRDREGRFDRGSAGIPAILCQALVLSAFAMMLVNALTIESPVTTV